MQGQQVAYMGQPVGADQYQQQQYQQMYNQQLMYDQQNQHAAGIDDMPQK